MRKLHDFLLTFLPLLALSMALVWGLIYSGPASDIPPWVQEFIDEPEPLVFPSFHQGARGRGDGQSPPTAPARPLFDAILEVESGGDNLAIGDGGLSLGPYQISEAYWQDACEYLGVNWDYDTCVWQRTPCEAIMVAYWDRWKARTDEERARMHNGGPQGHLHKSTLKYWERVKAHMIRRNP